MSKTIGLAILAKNEEAMIARCLDSVAWADQIVVVDTGSSDSTIEIALKYTEEVFLDFVWVDDFQLAQNHAKSKMKTDWILSLDCDEVLLSSEAEVREAIEKAQDVLRVTMVAEGDEKNIFYFGRIFRNSPDIFWEATIHKHLNIPGVGEDIGNVRIMYGRSPAHDLDPDRSLRMLESAVARAENLPRNLYYLGREYYYKERYQDSLDTLKRYVQIAHWAGELADAYLIMSQCYAFMGNAEQTATYCFQAILTNSNFKEAILYMASIVLPENKTQWLRMAQMASNEGLVWKRIPAEAPTEIILCAPHQDDETLFASFILMRTRATVISITDSHIQPERGEVGCEAEIRREETRLAMEHIGCPVIFLGIKDTELTEEILYEYLKGLNPAVIYAPAIQGGNAQHDMVGRVVKQLFGDRCKQYCTYTKTELYTTGEREIKPTEEELKKKEEMMSCYRSQLALPSTRPHFEAVIGKSEWLI